MFGPMFIMKDLVKLYCSINIESCKHEKQINKSILADEVKLLDSLLLLSKALIGEPFCHDALLIVTVG